MLKNDTPIPGKFTVTLTGVLIHQSPPLNLIPLKLLFLYLIYKIIKYNSIGEFS